MRRKIIMVSTFICLILAIGQAGYDNFLAAGLFSIWPVMVFAATLIDSVRRRGW